MPAKHKWVKVVPTTAAEAYGIDPNSTAYSRFCTRCERREHYLGGGKWEVFRESKYDFCEIDIDPLKDVPPKAPVAPLDPNATKVCPKCTRDLPLTAFSRSSSRRDGLQLWCKECKKNKLIPSEV
jgi:hypothetical protein